METLYRKEQILKAFREGKIIQSKNGNEWVDFIPQNQVDKPNLDYGGIDNWRIKGEIIKSENTETLVNTLQQIKKLETDKAELLDVLIKARDLIKRRMGLKIKEMESLIQKHK